MTPVTSDNDETEIPKLEILSRKNAPELAYIHTKGDSSLPTVLFLGGFRSDMMGTKAQFLENQCKARGQSYIRFDYSGHGTSGGTFEKGCIGDWTQDAIDVLKHCTSDPVLLVGSSMGGWISLLLALQMPERVQGLIGLAAAPDFTTWMEEKMSDSQKYDLQSEGYFELANDYDDAPYIITKRLIEDGRHHSLLDKQNKITCPVRLIQGKKDADVPWQTAEKIRDSIENNGNVKITYIEDADHRLSSPSQLETLDHTLAALLK